MKIAIVTERMIVGGTETYIIRKSRWLLNHGHQVVVISEGGELAGALPDGVKHVTVDFTGRPPYHFGKKQLSKRIMQLADILLENQVDVIETHVSCSIRYVAMSYRYHRIPYCLNVLMESAYDNRSLSGLNGLTRALDRRGLYMTLTERMNIYIERKCHHKLHPKILPIPLPLPPKKGLDVEPIVLTVGRLSPEKMYLRYLIDDFTELARAKRISEEIRLVVIGEGALYEEIRRQVDVANEALGREAVVMEGTVVGERLDQLYEQCLAYVGVGTTLLIAASFGKPAIIASCVKKYQPYAFGFWGEEPEKDGILIGGDESVISRRTSFKEVIEAVVMDRELRRDVSEASLKLFKEVYDMDSIMEKWSRIYEDVSARLYDKSLGRRIFQLYIHYCICFVLKKIRQLF